MANIYDPDTFQPREGLGYVLARARKTYILALEQELAPHDINSSQWAVILNLADGHAGTAGELCKVMRYNPGAMTRLLDRLEEKGFIRRTRTEADRRTIQLELTPAGKALRPKGPCLRRQGFSATSGVWITKRDCTSSRAASSNSALRESKDCMFGIAWRMSKGFLCQ